MSDVGDRGVSEGEHEFVRVSPLDVQLDPYNPRLTLEEEGSSQSALLEIMIKRFKIEELAESILASGFNPFDPIIGWSEDDQLTVLEGNRRVAAMHLLLEPQRAPAGYDRRWSALSERLTPEVRATFEQVDVVVYGDRDAADVASYIGFRHVTGVLKWKSLEKAKYMSRLVEQHGWTYARIAERLGSYPRHVERHYVAYRLVRQVAEEQLPGASKMEDAFGVLLRALQAEGITEFLGIEYPGDPEQSAQPVAAEKIENLRDFVTWTFGTEDRVRVLPDSRRLTDLGQILQSTEAVAYLRRAADPSFERAFFRSGGQARSLADSLFTAADRLEETEIFGARREPGRTGRRATSHALLEPNTSVLPRDCGGLWAPHRRRVIDLPPNARLDRLEQIADWVELCALGAEAGAVSQAEVADVVHDAGLLGGVAGDLFPGERDFESDVDTSEDDPLQSFAEDVWAVLAKRAQLLSDRYPLEINGEVIMVRGASWRESPCSFALTLLANIALYPTSSELHDVDGVRFSHLFEKIVQASAQGLFGGTTTRFGAPHDQGWPVSIDDRIRHLGALMRLRIENLEDKTDPLDKDKTLDIVSRLSFLDDGPGSVVVMAQCATGRNWRDKTGEPNVALWEDVLRWDAVLVRALAVPWWFGDEREYASQFRRFSKAMILDRPRLLAGQPDDHFDPDYRDRLERWCEGQLDRLPHLN